MVQQVLSNIERTNTQDDITARLPAAPHRRAVQCRVLCTPRGCYSVGPPRNLPLRCGPSPFLPTQESTA